MALKRRNKVDASFSMSSMTDLVFLLLVFFVIASMKSVTHHIKVNLPQSSATTSAKNVVANVSIDALGIYRVGLGSSEPAEIAPEALEGYLKEVLQSDSTACVALYADEYTSYKEIVNVLDAANKNKMKLVIATKGEKQ